ncbi:hypothetical protein A4U64_11200 [Rhodococcus sp. WB1]|nr:hypothetical protein A4U64_11200 [Rhodococcus sp. WB1]PND52353.1 hypothetical protein CQZ88_09145 [Rhodococcus sp. ENV425]
MELEKLKRQLDNEIEENRRAAEGKKEYDKLVLEAATTYAQTCSVALDEALDTDGLFNLVKDAFDTAAGLPDENAARKILFAADQTRNLKALARAFNSLQMVAPPEVLTPATRLNAAMAALLQTVTEPLAKALAFKSATDELKQFIDAFRAYIGYAPYTAEDAKRDAVSFVETLRQQVNQYVMRAKEEFRAAGFSTTPWD